MAGPRKTTTQQGLGWEHQQARAKALKDLRDGDPCPFCYGPMFREQKLDYDHVIPRSQGGTDGPRRLSHASCNRRAGGRLGAALTNGSRPPRCWCGSNCLTHVPVAQIR
ncbi:HNH endonuclease [Streptomyces sp. NPDC002144]